MIQKPKGFVPVMLTPFKDNGAIDFDSLTALTEFYLTAGATGLFANCLSSEMYELSSEERLAITEHVVKVAGAVPVVAAATFGRNMNDHVDFIKRINDLGVEAVILITGLLAEEDDSAEVFEDHVFQLIERTGDISLGFYECPEPYKRVLSADQLKRFVDTGRVIYHKDTCLDLGLIKQKIEATHSRSSFGLYDAYISHAIESLKAGAAGLSCIQGNYFPELVVWLCQNYDNPAFESQAFQLQQFFIDHMDVMHDGYPVNAKYFLQKRGLDISTFSRRDVPAITADLKERVERLYADFELLIQQIDLKL